MELQIQDLVSSIKKDGIESANREAAQILADAKAQAEKIVADARSEADKLRADAQAEIGVFKASAQLSAEQAKRDAVLAFRQEIGAELTKLLTQDTHKALDDKALAALITAALQGEDASAYAAEVASVTDALKSELVGELKAGLELRLSKKVHTGFRLCAKDGSGYIDCSDEELEAAFEPNTKLVFGETIANPALAVLDIERFAKAAHDHGVPLMVDNTFPTPVMCRPFEWGADIVTHSTTKYMDGHAAYLGGVIVDHGQFDWMAHADKFPGLTTPDESYHGVTYAEKFGREGAFITKATAQLMRDLGPMQNPQAAFFLNSSLESLHVRMPRHCENGLAVAKFLQGHPKVRFVSYPGLEGDKYYDMAQKYMPNGTCGVVSFGFTGGRAAAETFMKSLKLAQIATHVADARTCCLHPANATHRQMNDEELIACGISADMVRLSCGLEDTADLIADLEQALEQC